jgi:UDP-3-O-[3-hydroxymyristoyl] glucosamine N-acyltransferase
MPALKLSEIAAFLGRPIEPQDADLEINHVAGLREADSNSLSFLADLKYTEHLASSQAGAVILAPGTPHEKPAILSEEPYADFIRVVQKFFLPEKPEAGIHPTAVIAPSAILGEGVYIGPYCVIGENSAVGARSILHAAVILENDCVVGKDCEIYSHVTIRENCRLGDRVILQPGAVIGGDGFGFLPHQGQMVKIPQIGRVVIEDDVEIGANTTVDRATLGETIIAKGAKLDNLIMVAHNVKIGRHTVIAGQSGISGSTTIGDWVMMGGQVGTAGHITIGNKAVIGAQSGIMRDVPDGEFHFGYPAKPQREYMKQLAEINKLSELRKKVKDLERQVQALTEKT